jgi:hypothetical protein
MSSYKVADTPLRDGEKQSRAADRNRSVRVIDAVGRLVRVIREPEAIAKHLSAPNAQPIRSHGGRLCGIQLSSLADDRGAPGERHGSSLIPTERCKNDWGDYIGPPIRVKHKDDRSEDR